MITLSTLGIQVDAYLLIFLGFSVGVISGFMGVGGGFLITPSLIILGVPANFAVGTSIMWVMANSIVGFFNHHRLGYVDIKLALIMASVAIGGAEVGVRALNSISATDHGQKAMLLVLLCLLLLLFTVGVYMILETRKSKNQLAVGIDGKEESVIPPEMSKTLSRKLQNIYLPPMIYFPRSDIRMSLWVLLFIGFTVGLLSGFLGVGGGFILTPSLIYLVGLNSFNAVGTGLFQLIFPSAYGSFRYIVNGNVIIYIVLILLISSSIGVKLGAKSTRYVNELTVRYLLAIASLIGAMGVLLKLVEILSMSSNAWLNIASVVVTFGGMIALVIFIFLLSLMSVRLKKGKYIPKWFKPFLNSL